MEISIAINNYKNPELLRLCIESIKKNVSTDVDYEIIVADSATEEVTEIMMREDFPEIKFFSFKKNVGFRVMVEKGIKESQGEYILLLNGDILVTPNAIEKLLAFIKSNSKIGIVGPKLLNFNGSFQYSCFRFYKPLTILYRRTFLGKFKFARRHLNWFLMKEYNHREPKEVDWLMGSALLVSRRAIDKVGFMDEKFFMYMEDVDWCRRFWENNFKVIYYPQAEMLHYHGEGSRGGFWQSIFANRLTRAHISSGFWYFWKYHGKNNPRLNSSDL